MGHASRRRLGRRRRDQTNEAIGALVRQRLEQHAMDDAEDSGGGADAEREGDEGDECKPGARRSARNA